MLHRADKNHYKVVSSPAYYVYNIYLWTEVSGPSATPRIFILGGHTGIGTATLSEVIRLDNGDDGSAQCGADVFKTVTSNSLCEPLPLVFNQVLTQLCSNVCNIDLFVIKKPF